MRHAMTVCVPHVEFRQTDCRSAVAIVHGFPNSVRAAKPIRDSPASPATASVFSTGNQRSQDHRQGDHRDQGARILGRHDLRCRRSGVEDEAELASLAEQEGRVDRRRVAVSKKAGQGVDDGDLDREQNGHGQEKLRPDRGNKTEVYRPSYGQEEQAEEEATEGLDVWLQLVAVA